MSLSNSQKALCKRAQREADVPDEEYRDFWRMLTKWEDCDTSTDPRLGDAHLDKMLKFLEAIFWRRVDEGTLKESTHPKRVFRARGFWAGRNERSSTSRDQWAARKLEKEIESLSNQLVATGYPPEKIYGLKRKLNAAGPWALKSALTRTLRARQPGIHA